MAEHRSPIERLGYTGWKQYSIFKNHLRLPLPYLQVIVRNYRDLVEVPVLLPRLTQHIDNHIWSTMDNKTQKLQMYKTKGVPVPYLNDDSPPIAGVKVYNAYQAVFKDIDRFLARPLVLYCYSGFETSALRAASNIVKTTLDFRIDARMVSFPRVLEEVKTWDKDNFLLQRTGEVRLLCLFMVGKEYMTDFTQATLRQLIETRRAEGKTTIITTHLEPAEFIKRYGFDPQAIPMKFEDEGVISTVDELVKYMTKEA